MSGLINFTYNILKYNRLEPCAEVNEPILDKLPPELFVKILSKLHLPDLIQSSRINNHWNSVIFDSVTLKTLIPCAQLISIKNITKIFLRNQISVDEIRDELISKSGKVVFLTAHTLEYPFHKISIKGITCDTAIEQVAQENLNGLTATVYNVTNSNRSIGVVSYRIAKKCASHNGLIVIGLVTLLGVITFVVTLISFPPKKISSPSGSIYQG